MTQLQVNAKRIAELAKRVQALEAELEQYKKAVPLCGQHEPDGGSRGRCVVCAMMSMSAALSRIDYACGTPNEFEVASYDFHCCEHVVADRVIKTLEFLKDKQCHV